MRIIGSKRSLLSFIEEGIKQIVPEEKGIFLDGFLGSGAVGKHFKDRFTVYANDLQFYSVVNAKHYLQNNAQNTNYKKLLSYFELDSYTQLEDRLNQELEAKAFEDGFIFNHYAPNGQQNKEFQRTYFTDENAVKIDTARELIDDWKSLGYINSNENYHLLASLLHSADKVANTTGVYAAYLKSFKSSATKQFRWKLLPIENGSESNKVFNQDINELIKEVEGDVLYLDPPYNSRQYCDNYHLLETIAKKDNPDIKGKTGIRAAVEQKSNYSVKRKAKEELEELIKNAKFKYIFMSYNNEGIISLDEVQAIFKKYGEYKLLTQEYRRYKSSRIEGQNPTVLEYLHCLIKN